MSKGIKTNPSFSSLLQYHLHRPHQVNTNLLLSFAFTLKISYSYKNLIKLRLTICEGPADNFMWRSKTISAAGWMDGPHCSLMIPHKQALTTYCFPPTTTHIKNYPRATKVRWGSGLLEVLALFLLSFLVARMKVGADKTFQ